MPQGKEYYAYLARRHTSTAMTPAEIHALGESEVQRIRARMDQAIAQTGFKGTFQEFLASVRKDPRFYVGAAEYGEKASEIAKRADFAMPKYFGKLPRLSYGVLPIPAGLESSANGYLPGSPEQGVAGMVVYKPWMAEKMPTFGLAAWVLHEGVPGHHHQISLSQELTDLPEFRRADDVTAYVEGWGLYSEYLGEEMGIYRDPVRAVRPALARDLARVPAGGRYGHARDGLVARAGDGLPAGKQCARPGGNRVRSRSLHRVARPGARVQDRRTQDHRTAPAGDGAGSDRSSTCANSTTWSWAPGRCRSTCSRPASTAGSRQRTAR